MVTNEDGNSTNQDDGIMDTEYSLITKFYLDTNGYSDRDRLMFCCGYEFQSIVNILDSGESATLVIHRENESRIRMLCGSRGRVHQITYVDEVQDPDGTWAFLSINGKRK